MGPLIGFILFGVSGIALLGRIVVLLNLLIELSFNVFRTLPGSLLRLAGGTGGIRLDMM